MLGPHPSARDRAGGTARRARPRRPAHAGLPLRQRLDGRRGRAEDGRAVVAPARRDSDRSGFICLARRLPRRHARLRVGRRHRPLPRRLPPAAVRVLAGRPRRRRPHGASCSRPTGDRCAAVIVEPLVQGAAGMLVHPPGYLRRGARAVRCTRDPADLRRGRDRLRAHGTDVRLRARGRGARLPLRRQGRHGRLSPARGHAHDRGRLRGLPRRPRGAPDLLPRPHVHGQPAGVRRRARDARRVRGRAHAGEGRAARSTCWAICWPSTSSRSPACARCAAAG